ncbi:sce7726 family protein [Bacillus pseudomycoides]|uniref:sce7726 family protein n=1 Tax=Bacillus pseudomycoides TaxID=64104 RepID=UPI000BF0719C|nr:sce7726 family protein [Bacillus pseudomycoides]PEK69621.1 hypothetical protein CN590_10000 [Bacillus pseudomycoides]
MRLRDRDVRKKLLQLLQLQYGKDEQTRIINELGMDFGASRVDVAVVNGILHGYEIKSESDNLNRLPRQMSYYNRLFEQMTIVVDESHYQEIINIVPPWWGIMLVKKKKNDFQLVPKREGRKNNSQEKEILLKLLWKRELEKFIDVFHYPKRMKRLRKDKLVEQFQEQELYAIREFVYHALKVRENWRKD